MKRLIIALIALAPVSGAVAQKAVKPNVNKIQSLWKSGKLGEAKEVADVTVTAEKTQNDGKAWYYRGLVYASLDTTSNADFKKLAENPLQTAMESFAKADQLNSKSKSEFFVSDAMGLPQLKSQQILMLSNFYLNEGAIAYQEDDLENALKNFEKSQIVTPSDTTAFFYAGFVASALEDMDKATVNFEKYLERGGKSSDAYLQLISIASRYKEDKALALEYARKAKAKFPANKEFPKVEIGLLIDMEKIDEAKGGLEQAIATEPNNKVLHFYLGYVNSKLEKWEDAKKNYQQALKIDPEYFDAQYYLAQIYLIDAERVRKELNSLGITQADRKKKMELDKQLVEKYKTALPFLEQAEKMKTEDNNAKIDILDKLSSVYYYLGEDAKAAAVNKRLKDMGVDSDD